MPNIEILKIESHRTKMSCKFMELRLTANYEEFPKKISLFGESFYRSGWNSDRGIIYYSSSLT